MPIATDFSVSAAGDIRHTGVGTTVYPVLDLHAWLQDLADNPAPVGDDVLSILSANPSKIAGPRATNKPMSVTLLGTVNLDDATAQYFNFGSVEQASGATLYTGVKSIGSPLAPGSPIYIVQNSLKVMKYWGTDHIAVMVKAKFSNALIDNGDIRAYSRKFGQLYADFAANLTAGSEQPVAISTATDSNIALSLAAALALSANITVTVGDSPLDLGNGNGSKTYNGTIALTGGITLAQAYQYLMAITSETSAVMVNGSEGWRFRALSSYAPNAAAPFGTRVGGKFFLARGWKITGVIASESQSYQLIAADGSDQIPPNSVTVTIGALVVGDHIICGRDAGTDILFAEYTLNGSHASGLSTVTVNGAIKTDTPTTGWIRVNEVNRFAYTAWAGSTFTITGTLGQSFATNTPAFVPFIDKTVSQVPETSSFIFAAGFTARVKVRKGDTIKPFETTFAVGSAGGGINAIRDSDV